MPTSQQTVEGGFADPVFAAQTVFRAVMDAMARPGTIQAVATEARPPAPLGAVAAAIVLTLADADTPVWLDAELSKNDAVKGWIAFHTGAPLTGVPSEAAFALVTSAANLPPLTGFALGTHEYPDRSTTVIAQVGSLTDGDALTLSGPGIETTRAIAPKPLPAHFEMQWREINGLYPRGLDLVLAGADAVACLPRTTRIGKGEA